MPDALDISRLVHEGFFHRFRVSIHHRQVGAHRAFWTAAPLLPFLKRARALRNPLLSPKGATEEKFLVLVISGLHDGLRYDCSSQPRGAAGQLSS
jgi:hypothetical protein